MTSIENVIAAQQLSFDSLDRTEQQALWSSFVDAVDAGDAGHHPYYLILAPLYEGGYVPWQAEWEAEMRADLQLEIEYAAGSNRLGELQSDCTSPEFWDRFEPATADALLGCPPF